MKIPENELKNTSLKQNKYLNHCKKKKKKKNNKNNKNNKTASILDNTMQSGNNSYIHMPGDIHFM
ncbi:hypothetical protein V7L74_001325 [Salmonella enterica]